MGACHRCIVYRLTSLKTKYLTEEFCPDTIGKKFGDETQVAVIRFYG